MAEEPTSLHGIHNLQTMLFTMLGGGSLGRRLAEQPTRTRILPGRFPYPHRAIGRVRWALIERAQAYGLDPDALPPMPALCGLAAWPEDDGCCPWCPWCPWCAWASMDQAPRGALDPAARPALSLPPLPCVQSALYAMCGGGSLGWWAATHPATFRIPPGMRLPYPHRRISRVTATLVELARASSLDPAALPPLPPLVGLDASPAPPPLRVVRQEDGEPRPPLRGTPAPPPPRLRLVAPRAPETVQPDGASH